LSPAAQWFVDLVPSNAIRAAADDLMLPTIVFSVLFGIALSRVTPDRRAAVLRVVEGIAEAMQKLVAMILALAPVGVFALAVPLASRLGYAAAGAVAAYVLLVVLLTIAASLLLLYPLGVVAGRMRPSAFAALCAPAQAVALASRSSLAALPAMIESAERAAFPPQVTGFLLPLAASTFRFGAAVAQSVGVIFLARLYDIHLGAPQLASLFVAVIFTTFAVPGIPGGSILAMLPVLAAVNVPAEGVGILLAVDTIPDMFRTTANVTGSLAIATALASSVAPGTGHSAPGIRHPSPYEGIR
jgi:Na+/H+-dicarboxylate symporter